MNQPENLKTFMSFLGVPKRKYEDIMEDLGLYVFEKKKKETFKQILQEKEEVERKYQCLRQQLLDNSLTPNDFYEHDPTISNQK